MRNGLALSKNAHWLFDQGLWTIADDYTVVVAIGQFTEQSPDQKALRDYHGQKIRLPNDLLYGLNLLTSLGIEVINFRVRKGDNLLELHL